LEMSRKEHTPVGRLVTMRGGTWGGAMLKFLPVFFVLLCIPSLFHAQTIISPGQQRAISGSASPLTNPPLGANPLPVPTRARPLGTCVASAQSVCNDGFQSCNASCAAAVSTAASVGVAVPLSSCNDRCCAEFNVCLHQRACPSSPINCFSNTTSTAPVVPSTNVPHRALNA
jgi:hypothetical protein